MFLLQEYIYPGLYYVTIQGLYYDVIYIRGYTSYARREQRRWQASLKYWPQLPSSMSSAM